MGGLPPGEDCYAPFSVDSARYIYIYIYLSVFYLYLYLYVIYINICLYKYKYAQNIVEAVSNLGGLPPGEDCYAPFSVDSARFIYIYLCNLYLYLYLDL